MNITKCDFCKKTINKGDEIIVVQRMGDIYESIDLCSTCGNPVVKLLDSKKPKSKKHGK